jgi:DEAD/DEAH box helicase domain-containing protein
MAIVADADLDLFLARLAGDPRLVHVERLPARPARHQRLTRPLPRGLPERFGVGALWSHQAEAIDLVREGRSVAVATGTGSGKSLCYQLPIAESVAGPRRRTRRCSSSRPRRWRRTSCAS